MKLINKIQNWFNRTFFKVYEVKLKSDSLLDMVLNKIIELESDKSAERKEFKYDINTDLSSYTIFYKEKVQKSIFDKNTNKRRKVSKWANRKLIINAKESQEKE
jgi:hypothetical protein